MSLGQRVRMAEALAQWLLRQEGVENIVLATTQVGPLGGVSSRLLFDLVTSEGRAPMALNLYDLREPVVARGTPSAEVIGVERSGESFRRYELGMEDPT